MAKIASAEPAVLEKGQIYVLDHADVNNENVRVKSLFLCLSEEPKVQVGKLVNADGSLPKDSQGRDMKLVGIPREYIYSYLHISTDDLESSNFPGCRREDRENSLGIPYKEPSQEYFERFVKPFIISQDLNRLWKVNDPVHVRDPYEESQNT